MGEQRELARRLAQQGLDLLGDPRAAGQDTRRAEAFALRVKGFAAIPNKPMRLLIQGVGTRFDKHFDRKWGADEARTTRLVLIGQELDAAQLEAQLRAALSV